MELVNDHGMAYGTDMNRLYQLTVEDCNNTPEQMQKFLALAINDRGAPEITRVGMRYVCPGRVHMVDDALTELQRSRSEIRAACATPPNLRTSKQQELIDAVGCKP